MLSAEAVKEIADLGVDAESAEFHTDEHGITHIIYRGKATPLLEPLVGPVRVRTLAAVVDYLLANRDGLALKELSVLAEPGRVEVVSKARIDGRRQIHLVADEPDVSRSFGDFLGKFMAIEDFVIAAQCRFRPGGQLEEMLYVVGNITQQDVRSVADDGVSQEVTVRQGVVKVASATLPNPVKLCPRRSFPEVELALVPFVLRVRKTQGLPEVALFNADGGAWAVDATDRVAGWLRSEWLRAGGSAAVDDIPFGILA